MKRIFILALVAMCMTFVALGQKQKAAVWVTGHGTESGVNKVLESEFVSALSQSNYAATNRTGDFVSEMGKEQGRETNNEWIAKQGKRFGMDVVCIANVTNTLGSNYVAARLVDVVTATVVASYADTSGLKTIVDLMGVSKKIVARLVSSSTGGQSTVKDIEPDYPAEPGMIFVEGGQFWMGCSGEQGDNCEKNESPLHRVTVSSFYISKYEITQEKWKLIMGKNPSNFKNNNHPVEKISWIEIQEFIRRLNSATNKQYRLPTEAEWEYAARGGVKSKKYNIYSGSNNIDKVAWVSYNSNGSTHVVGTKAPNELGIHDMSGNVWEWCSDWYEEYSAATQYNPKGPSTGFTRVFRGGSWYYIDKLCRVSYRNCRDPTKGYANVGFRLVLPYVEGEAKRGIGTEE
jgi:formylglycine-generating enzyme required for sulfatase activity